MKNRVLSDSDVKQFSDIINNMYKVLPEMMKRKIPGSEVQAAFAIDYLINRHKDKKILCVGSYEDVACAYLKVKGIKMIEIDPVINSDLHTFKESTKKKFDIIFSVSVIEHVEDDEQFIKDICQLMNVGGIGLLTMDFLDNQPVIKYTDLVNQFLTAEGVKNGIRMGREKRMELRRLQDQMKQYPSNTKPKEDCRLYTVEDYKRLSKVMKEYDCFMVDEISADVEPYFEHDGCKYSFSTMVFRKLR